MAETEYDERLGAWDGDEYNARRTMPRWGWLMPRSDWKIKQGPIDKTKIWVTRTQPRDPETRAIAFDMSFNVGTDDEVKLRVPILALMDMNSNSFPYPEVSQAVDDWVEKAKEYPNTRRKCLCCRRKATKGLVLCKGCGDKFGKVIYSE